MCGPQMATVRKRFDAVFLLCHAFEKVPFYSFFFMKIVLVVRTITHDPAHSPPCPCASSGYITNQPRSCPLQRAPGASGARRPLTGSRPDAVQEARR